MEEWYWDQFNLEERGGQLDITNDDVLDQADLTRQEADRYETKFIDELYGTVDARWGYPDPEYEGQTREGTPEYGPGKGEMRSQGSGSSDIQIGSYSGDSIDYQWGLDLRRVDNEALTVGTPEHYQHLTRGEVDWASYEKDPKYIAAFEDMKSDEDYTFPGDVPNDLSFLTESGDSDDFTGKEKVQWIREANQRLANGLKSDDASEDAWRFDWSGKYDSDHITKDDAGNLFIDGERQQTLLEKYAKGEGKLNVGFEAKNAEGVSYTVSDTGEVSASAFDPIKGPPTAVVRPNIRPPNIKVQIPANVPASWKTHVKQTTTHKNVGGDS
tara:strand:+ start:480 stop:1460 length:981 start_codon:yes stop_codon:yes gene_type:complete